MIHMTKLESVISASLQQLKPDLSGATWASRRRYFNQMVKLAKFLNITEPCQELYNAFIADGNDSKGRRSMHIRCVKLVDALAGTKAMDDRGIPFNESLPAETEVGEFFLGMSFPTSINVPIEYLIVKASIEMRHLNLTDSTIGQYRHSWIDIKRYFYAARIYQYDEALMQDFIHEINNRRNNGSMKEWKWKINRKAAHVLMEVADTGCFRWGAIRESISHEDPEIESIRLQYLDSLKERNLSKSTINLYDYVFRKTMDFAGITTAKDLQLLSSGSIQLVVGKFSDISNRRSMATILPILRSMLNALYVGGFSEKNLSGVVMSGFVQKGSVATYISEKDQTYLIEKLDEEPKRAKAIILLALRLGLRDCDISSLTFSEIDWQHDKIRLTQQKTGEPLVLPLLPDVGNALMDYILNERPKRNDRYPCVFLRKQAPHNKLTSVYAICSKFLDRFGITPVNGMAKGIHLFRYSMVRNLLAAKVPHQIITDALGHVSKESDKPYLSMEESMLRMCALDLSVIGTISWAGSAFR